MAEGIQLRLTHTGTSSSNILLDDIRGETSAGRRGLPPEYVYIPAPTEDTPNPSILVTYGGAVPMSLERGDIRKYIDNGFLTAEFVVGTNFTSAIPSASSPTEVTESPYTVDASEDSILLVNLTLDEAPSIVLPAGASFRGILWVKDRKGDAHLRNITITPDGASVFADLDYWLGSDVAGAGDVISLVVRRAIAGGNEDWLGSLGWTESY